jgi:cytochrome c-type biogenesis protein
MIDVVLPSSIWAATPVALAAGLVSFLSPCVLPLLPGYIAFLGGATNGLDSKRGRGRAIAGSFAFVLGFAVVFVSFGAAFGSFGATLKAHQRTLEIVFGVLTVGLGFFFAGWWPSKWLAREARSHRLPRATILGAFALGFLFALGWTPCIGPTLAAILGLAASSSGATAWRGSFLALVYCLGLGLPFIVAALATEWMSHVSTWLRSRQKLIGRIGGLLLIVIGLCEVSGWWHSFVLWLQTTFPSSSSLL